MKKEKVVKIGICGCGRHMVTLPEKKDVKAKVIKKLKKVNKNIPWPKGIKNLTVAQWKMRLLCKMMGLDYKMVHKLTK